MAIVKKSITVDIDKGRKNSRSLIIVGKKRVRGFENGEIVIKEIRLREGGRVIE